jgi:hypothetical protein
VPKAGGFNRQLDTALMRSTELRKRYTEDMERLKRQLPTAFVRATSRASSSWSICILTLMIAPLSLQEYGNSAAAAAAAAAIEWISEVEVDCPQAICGTFIYLFPGGASLSHDISYTLSPAVSTLDEQEATGETGALGLDSTGQFFEVGKQQIGHGAVSRDHDADHRQAWPENTERTTAVVCIICRQSYRRVHKFYGEKVTLLSLSISAH